MRWPREREAAETSRSRERICREADCDWGAVRRSGPGIRSEKQVQCQADEKRNQDRLDEERTGRGPGRFADPAVCAGVVAPAVMSGIHTEKWKEIGAPEGAPRT